MDNVRRLLEGERVEVRQKEVGLRGSWHPGVVVGVRDGRRVVEYDELLAQDGRKKLREVIPMPEGPWCKTGVAAERAFIRPEPPTCRLSSILFYKRGLLVDAFYDYAWWEGILLDNIHVKSEGHSKVRVLFPDEGDELSCLVKDIRVSQEWDEASGLWKARGSWSLRDESGVLAIDGLRGICRQKNSRLRKLWCQRSGHVRMEEWKSNAIIPVEEMKNVSPFVNGPTLPLTSEAKQPLPASCENLQSEQVLQVAAKKQTKVVKSTSHHCANSSMAPKTMTKQTEMMKQLTDSGDLVKQYRFAAKTVLLNAGWTKFVRTRLQGNSQGTHDTVYVAPNGSRFYSLASACRGWKKMNNLPSTIADSGISKEMELLDVYNIAKELISTSNKLMRRVKAKAGQSEATTRHKACTGVATAKSKKQVNHTLELAPLVVVEDNRKSKQTPFIEKVKKRKLSEDGATQHKCKKGRPSLKKGAKLHESKAPRSRGSCKMQVLLSSAGRPSAQTKSRSTVLSWLIEKGIIKDMEPCRYLSRKDGHVMKKGSVTREGVLCKCCKVVFALSNFEAHAGSKLHRPSANIFLDDGRSLTVCQLQACALQDAKEDALADVSDDTCGVCADGGELILCDHCPSTFHPACIGLKVIPDGDWFCPRCLCGVCGNNKVAGEEDYTMSRCVQCELEYHPLCVGEPVVLKSSGGRDAWFCGHQCEQIHANLRRLVGQANHLEDGFSWMLLRSMKKDVGLLPSNFEIMAEYNVKLGVAHDVMQECFVPMIDPRTKVDLISQALYNRSSKVFRLDYSGFYTIVLQKGDEMISVAAIRVHGCKLAEMPLVGTRYQYRRQGMCRRLMQALEQMLGNIGVQKLVLPAVPELLDTWTGPFEFQHMSLAETQELSKLNLMTFPGTTLLQKQLRRDLHRLNKDDNEDGLVDLGKTWDGVSGTSCLIEEVAFSRHRNQSSCQDSHDSPCDSSPGVGEGKKLDDVQYARVVRATTRSKRLVKSSKWIADGLNELTKDIDCSVKEERSLHKIIGSELSPASLERPSEVANGRNGDGLSSFGGTDRLGEAGIMFYDHVVNPLNALLAEGTFMFSPKHYVRRKRRELEEGSCLARPNADASAPHTGADSLADIPCRHGL